MSIKIIEQPDIYLTSYERDLLMHDYRQSMAYYAGAPISFEDWIRKHPGIIERIRGKPAP